MPKSETKKAWFGYCYAGTWKQFCHIWNQHPRIGLNAKFRGKTKMPILGPKMPYLGIFDQNVLFLCFWASISKSYCHIWNQHSQVCLIAKFCEKTKMLKFGTKNALFGYFWARILRSYYDIWNQHPQICQKEIFNSYIE